jgi:hypothetical protein
MIFGGSLRFICLNQDNWLLSEVEVQDLGIFRMWLDDFWWEFEVFLSESGCPGFEDVQDVVG